MSVHSIGYLHSQGPSWSSSYTETLIQSSKRITVCTTCIRVRYCMYLSINIGSAMRHQGSRACHNIRRGTCKDAVRCLPHLTMACISKFTRPRTRNHLVCQLLYILYTWNRLNLLSLWILQSTSACVYRASYCNVLITNEMHSSYNQFYSTIFVSSTFCAPDDERLDSFETCRRDKNCRIKLIIRTVHLVGY